MRTGDDAAQGAADALIEAAADAILIIDLDGTVVRFNRAAEELFGIAAADIRGLPVDRLIPASDRAEHHRHLQSYQPGTATRVVGRSRDLTAVRGDGTLFPIELSVSAIEHDGRPLFMGILRDISHRKRVERELIRAKEAAESADRAKSAFLAAMSHELRTPLNTVIGFAQIIEMRLLGDRSTDRYMEYATSIRRSGEHLLGIIDGILDLSKIEAGVLTLLESPVSLRRVIEESLTLVDTDAGRYGVAVLPVLPDALPPVMADELRLRQILVNLLSNAVKFSDRGGEVVVGARRDAGGGVVLTVRDTGIGMAADDISKALSAFGQLDGSLNRTRDGAGLGLPLSKRLVEMHGGTLEIESAPGKGTCVSVRIPEHRVLPPGTAVVHPAAAP